MIDHIVPGSNAHIDWCSTMQTHLTDFWLNALMDSPARAGIPIALCFLSQVSAASSAVSQYADMMHPISGRKMLPAVLAWGVAESGVGKTPAFDAFVQPTMDVFSREESQSGAKADQFKLQLRLWELKRKGIEKAIIKAAQTGEPDDHLHEAMQEHENNMPKDDRVLYQAMSFTAFAKASRTKHKRMFIASDEAHTVLQSELMSFPAALCSAWDGGDKTFKVEGAYRECSFDDFVLTSTLLVQPKFFDHFQAKNDGAARESGLMARSLIVRCMPGQDNGFANNVALDQGHRQAFLERLEELVVKAFQRRRSGDYSRTTLTFSHDAIALLKEERAAINDLAKPEGKLENISDYVAKYIDNACRIAGIFHVVDGLEGEISSITLSRAIAVMRLFLAEFKRLFDPTDDTPKSIRDAWRVTRYLYERYWVPNILPAVYNDVRQGRAVREGGTDFDAAIAWLEHIGFVTVEKSERKKLIRLNSIAFGQLRPESFKGPIPESFFRAPIRTYGNPSQGPTPFMGGLYSSRTTMTQLEGRT